MLSHGKMLEKLSNVLLQEFPRFFLITSEEIFTITFGKLPKELLEGSP